MNLQKIYLNNLSENRRGFAYTNTRVRAMKHELLTENDYQKLLKMSVNELTRYLGETTYRKEISELALKYSGVVLIEYGLNKNLENTFKKIYSFSMKNARHQIGLYLKKWEIFNVKTILRGKLTKTSKSEILNNLIVFDEHLKQFFENIVENASDFDEAVLMLKNEPYYEILRSNQENLGVLEDELDKYYYEFVVQESQPELKKYMSDEVKILNQLNKIRAKNEGFEDEEIEKYLIKGFDNNKKKIKSKESEPENPLSLRKKLLKTAIRKVHIFKRTFAPVLGYFLAKENEVRNLRLIIRGKHNNIDSEIIEQHLVI